MDGILSDLGWEDLQPNAKLSALEPTPEGEKPIHDSEIQSQFMGAVGKLHCWIAAI